jgi:hypothetical protein
MSLRPLKLPSKDELVKRFIYNPNTGKLLHRHSLTGKHKARQEVGYIANSGYLLTWAVDNYYLVHRIIWKMVYNEDPIEIDHKDRNRTNNKLNNLRSVLEGTNQQNREKRNKYTGIRRKPSGKYMARIQIDNKQIHLGTFNSLPSAIKARQQAEERYNRKLR